MVEEKMIRIEVEVSNLGEVDNIVFGWQAKGWSLGLSLIRNKDGVRAICNVVRRGLLNIPWVYDLAHFLTERPCRDMAARRLLVSATSTRLGGHSPYPLPLPVL